MATASEEMNSKSILNNIPHTLGRKAQDLINSIRTRISEQEKDIKNIERKLLGHASESIETNKHENFNQITNESCDVTCDDVSGRHQTIRQGNQLIAESNLWTSSRFISSNGLNFWAWPDSMKYAAFYITKYPWMLISKLVASKLSHLIQPPGRCKKRAERYVASDNYNFGILFWIGLFVMLIYRGVDGRKVQEGKSLELRPNHSDAQMSAWTFTPLNDTSVFKTLCQNGEEKISEKITMCQGYTCIPRNNELQISNFQRCHEGRYTFSGVASCDGTECDFTENYFLTIDDADVAVTSESPEAANSLLPFPEQNSTSRVPHSANDGRGYTAIVVVCSLVSVALAIAAIVPVYKFKLWKNAKKNTEQSEKMLESCTEAEIQRNGLVC